MKILSDTNNIENINNTKNTIPLELRTFLNFPSHLEM